MRIGIIYIHGAVDNRFINFVHINVQMFLAIANFVKQREIFYWNINSSKLINGLKFTN